jgi:D-alanine--poly(phosphoribitol) ligase subunit 1
MTQLFDFLYSQENDDRSAVYINERYITYLEFKNSVFSIANEIKNHKLSQSRIGVYLNDSIYTYASIYAIWITGNIYVPLHSSYPEKRLKEIASQANLSCILSSENGTNLPLDFELIRTDKLNDTSVFLPYKHAESDIFHILFTSGSTGVPKGVQISYGNVISFLEHIDFLKLGLTSNSGFLQPFDLTFDLSILSTLLPFMHQGTLYHVSSATVKYLEIYRLLEEFDIEFAIIVPSVLNMLKNYFDSIQLDSLKAVALSGEAVPIDLTEKWQQCCPNARFFNFYGPTECTIFCTCYEIPRTRILQRNGIVSIGSPTIMSTSLLLDEQMKEVTTSSKGELWIGGEQVSKGYVNNQALNDVLFKEINGSIYYNTGDVVERDNENNLFYLGRKDQQIKRNGFRIELSEIEYKATLALNVQTCVISKIQQESIDIILVLVKDSYKKELISEVLKSQLPAFMIPNVLFEIDEFPLNDNGKLDRKKISQLYDSSRI